MPKSAKNISPEWRKPNQDDPDAWNPDTGPVWTREMFDRAEIRHGDRLIRAGDEAVTHAMEAASPGKRQVTLRIDSDILDRFRAGGPGWQTRINEALRKATI